MATVSVFEAGESLSKTFRSEKQPPPGGVLPLTAAVSTLGLYVRTLPRTWN
jgi:hypothetical protein